MLSTIFQLVVAGHDTTTSLIGNGTVALLRHPEQRDALVADPGLVPRAVEEILRWDAPVPHSTFRYATEDVRIGDIVDPRGRAGDRVAGGRRTGTRRATATPSRSTSPAPTTTPPRLRPRHPPLPRRPLARLEARIAFTALLTRFPAMRLAVPPAELRWGHGDGLVLRGLTALPVLLAAARAAGHSTMTRAREPDAEGYVEQRRRQAPLRGVRRRRAHDPAAADLDDHPQAVLEAAGALPRAPPPRRDLRRAGQRPLRPAAGHRRLRRRPPGRVRPRRARRHRHRPGGRRRAVQGRRAGRSSWPPSTATGCWARWPSAPRCR